MQQLLIWTYFQDPKGHTLGILGFGSIGGEVARKAQALGMKVIYNKRTRLPQEHEEKLNIKYATFDELIQSSDCISIHVPLSKDSRHLLSKREFDMMKPRVRIVHTSRVSGWYEIRVHTNTKSPVYMLGCCYR